MQTGVWTGERRPLTAGLVLIVTVVAFESLALATIMPLVSAELEGVRLYGWAFSAFWLGNLVGIVAAGRDADRHGPARPFVAGLVLFSAGLAAGGLSPSMDFLVLARTVQGIGTGALPAVAYVVIGRAYVDSDRPRMMAILSTAWVVPSVVGPGAAVIIAEQLGWRAVFFAILPIGAVAAALTLPGLRRLGRPTAAHEAPEHRLRDALLLALATALLLAGFTSGSLAVMVILVAAGLVAVVRPLRRLLPPGVFSARAGLPAAILTRGLLTFAFFGADVFVPYLVHDVRGRSAALGGLALTVSGLTWTVGAWTQERKLLDWGARPLATSGAAMVVAGIGLAAVALSAAMPVAFAVAGWAVAGLGIGLAYPTTTVIVLAEAPRGREGSASASLQLADVLGVALGTGLSGAVVALGDSRAWDPAVGTGGAFLLAGLVGMLCFAASHRLPGARVPEPVPPGPPGGPAPA